MSILRFNKEDVPFNLPRLNFKECKYNEQMDVYTDSAGIRWSGAFVKCYIGGSIA